MEDNSFHHVQPKYDLKYYVKMGQELKQAGAHILGLKDMGHIPSGFHINCFKLHESQLKFLLSLKFN